MSSQIKQLLSHTFRIAGEIHARYKQIMLTSGVDIEDNEFSCANLALKKDGSVISLFFPLNGYGQFGIRLRVSTDTLVFWFGSTVYPIDGSDYYSNEISHEEFEDQVLPAIKAECPELQNTTESNFIVITNSVNIKSRALMKKWGAKRTN